MTLWRYNEFTGLWNHERSVTPETAAQWLSIFCRDEPGVLFVVSTRKPRRPKWDDEERRWVPVGRVQTCSPPGNPAIRERKSVADLQAGLPPDPRKLSTAKADAFGQALHAALEANEGEAILRSARQVQARGWSRGGCAILAAALVAWYPGFGLVGRADQYEPRDVDHVLVRYGNHFFDGYGRRTASELIRRTVRGREGYRPLQKQWRMLVPLESPVVEPLEPHVGRIWCPGTVVRELTAYLRAQLGTPQRWGFAGVRSSPAIRERPHETVVMRVHHGSAVPFWVFDPQRVGTSDEGLLGHGFYFSTDPAISRSDAAHIEAEVRLNRPLHVSLPEWTTPKERVVSEALGLPRVVAGRALSKALTMHGYDGVILDYSGLGYHHAEVMVLKPRAIRVVDARWNTGAAEPAVEGVKRSPGPHSGNPQSDLDESAQWLIDDIDAADLDDVDDAWLDGLVEEHDLETSRQRKRFRRALERALEERRRRQRVLATAAKDVREIALRARQEYGAEPWDRRGGFAEELCEPLYEDNPARPSDLADLLRWA